MIELAPDETVLLTMRRHWVVFVTPLAVFVVALLMPPAALAIAPIYFPVLAEATVRPLITFFLALYLTALTAYLLIVWLSYYLDVWIITDHRIIDVEQHGLFRRSVSEIALERVQNVGIEIPGFLATMLGFGNVKIQTAGEGDFNISEVADFERAKDLILRYSRAAAALGPGLNPWRPHL